MSNNFISIDRNEIILPANFEGLLAENHLARFIVDVVEILDTSALENAYKRGGSDAFPPRMMLALLFYCYATGIFSSRKIERATYELIPVLYIAGGKHPDHDSINRFRKKFLQELEGLFIQILQIAHGLGVLKLGDISLDGTKIEANASKHKAMSWEHANKLETLLRKEIADLLKMAKSGNEQGNNGLNIPAELDRRENRLEKIARIKAEIEQRAQERYEHEKAEYEAKLKEREEKEKARGRKLGGKVPKVPEPGPRDKDQVNFTDGDSRIMPVPGGGFEQAYNAQASVDMETLLIVGQHVSQQPNDKQEVEPALEELNKLPEELGQVSRGALDNGYYSDANIEKLEKQGINPHIACSRQPHNQPLERLLTPTPEEPPKEASTIERMRHRLKTPEGKAFYARRKTTVEPAFGIIKEVMGFRRFMLRGFEVVRGEWTLVCLAFNLKRLCALNP